MVKRRMLTDAAEPVLGVSEVAFSPVYNRVPEAAGGRLDGLADLVRLVQVVVQQPNAGDAAFGHLPVDDASVRKRRLDRQLFERSKRTSIRPTGVESATPVAGQKRGENGAVLIRVKRGHPEIISDGSLSRHPLRAMWHANRGMCKLLPNSCEFSYGNVAGT